MLNSHLPCLDSISTFLHHSSEIKRLLLSSHKTFFQTMSSMAQQKTCTEIRIPISYGFIAAKAWGDENGIPVLALHGWQDNAGTFDKLIPLLDSKLYIVAIDAPGHGMSSHKPHGSLYNYVEMLLDIKRVADFLKWETFSIIGHSLGATLALIYAGIFPESVKNLVILDIIKPASRIPSKLPNETRKGILEILKFESKPSKSAPIYEYDKARARLIAGMYQEITPESADILLKRGSKPSECGKGVIFSRDIRVKFTEDLQKFSHEALKAYLSRMKCNLLIILGKQSVIFRSRTPEVLDEFIDLYKKVCQTFEIIEVEGNHFVHLNNPERVSPYINNFFNKYSENISKI